MTPPTAHLQIYTTRNGHQQRVLVCQKARLDEAENEEKAIRFMVNQMLEENPEYDPRANAFTGQRHD